MTKEKVAKEGRDPVNGQRKEDKYRIVMIT